MHGQQGEAAAPKKVVEFYLNPSEGIRGLLGTWVFRFQDDHGFYKADWDLNKARREFLKATEARGMSGRREDYDFVEIPALE